MYSELGEQLSRVIPPLSASLLGGGALLRVANPLNGRFTIIMTTEVHNSGGRAWGYFWHGSGQAWHAPEAARLLARYLA
ncbi:hypothetical protein [Actinomadura rupiterrae]|uniref:hypothetical protein n=1 Tax=Actinomadura rupiterrae TaxID=559627 RepID=UPI0020A4DE8C|nr:hypothetical protein [Actinomadura rupiterrae]MCP2342016.1 hypothetical protein [Actinomadura rupiterrae]